VERGSNDKVEDIPVAHTSATVGEIKVKVEVHA